MTHKDCRENAEKTGFVSEIARVSEDGKGQSQQPDPAQGKWRAWRLCLSLDGGESWGRAPGSLIDGLLADSSKCWCSFLRVVLNNQRLGSSLLIRWISKARRGGSGNTGEQSFGVSFHSKGSQENLHERVVVSLRRPWASRVGCPKCPYADGGYSHCNLEEFRADERCLAGYVKCHGH